MKTGIVYAQKVTTPIITKLDNINPIVNKLGNINPIINLVGYNGPLGLKVLRVSYTHVHGHTRVYTGTGTGIHGYTQEACKGFKARSVKECKCVK